MSNGAVGITKVSINLNEMIWVKLTPEGKAVYEMHTVGGLRHHQEKDGWFRFQLHDFIRVFGPHLQLFMNTLFTGDIMLVPPGHEGA